MPPTPEPPIDTEVRQLTDEGGLPPHQDKSGPMIGTIIIVILLIAGALYFWHARLRERSARNQVPYIPAETTTVQIPQ